MGTFTHTITLLSPVGNRREPLDALVDTGATFTTIPAEILEDLGVVREETIRLRLANGQIEEYSLGTVRAELEGHERTILCVFGSLDAPPLIGAHTLEAFLLAVDPVEKRLVPVEAYWM